MAVAYDIIGDVHGCASPLRSLLERMGYREIEGVYRHPGRKVVFLGDIIDRGPEIREALHIVKAMVDAGQAQMVMGNHEYNAIGYTTKAPPDLGRDYLRSHNPRHASLIMDTLFQMEDYPQEWQMFLDWFKTLPVFLELDNCRVVHACWDDGMIQQFKHEYGGNQVSEAFIRASGTEGSFENRFMDRLTRGTEMALPEGVVITGKDGFHRRFFRTKFWSQHPITYGDVVFQPDPLPQDLVEMPLSEVDRQGLIHYPEDAPPVFVGHYWLDGCPTPLAKNVACLDFSAVKGERLVAYRFDGEQALSAAKFEWVYNDAAKYKRRQS